ncbi:hypothetical protein IQ260_21990 [Leptolyngbya cf. ectocarpi LEGE 11479]|uniref:Uncharacterized protein n=1 Tax=Leptolyngbya cf. ectocarpi LEGE 11479 TaxID=1828722 RepID=A0A928ZXR0_LEPEC|nr:hypothetical protein [Leptolyngbya ectocarpi]MBE9069318.1 hypothetical protein [Leptolyngbya cf. ectocarpi LEGE 11479]
MVNVSNSLNTDNRELGILRLQHQKIFMQFQTSHIPSDIDTYEKLVAWGCTALNAHGYAMDYNERPPSVVTGDSGIQPQFERNGPFVSHQKDFRLVFRCAFLLNEDHSSAVYSMEYQAVKEVITAPVNVDFIA